jgi:glycosyltransferase involved in cell wall biosynthesis
MKIGVFVTSYNVEKYIVGQVLSRIPESVFQKVTGLIVVDNCSTDKTLEEVERFRHSSKWGEKVKILKNHNNYGYGGSHKVAFDYFLKHDFDYCILLHGDGQGDPHYLLQFISEIEAKKPDIVIGSRFMKESDRSDYSLLRTVVNFFFIYLQGFISGLKISDPGSGFLAYNLKSISTLPYKDITSYFSYDPCLFLLISRFKKDAKIIEFPISWGEVESSSVNIIEYGCRLLWTLIKFRVNWKTVLEETSCSYTYDIS